MFNTPLILYQFKTAVNVNKLKKPQVLHLVFICYNYNAIRI